MLLRTVKLCVVLLLLCTIASGCRSRRPHNCSGIQTQPAVDPMTVLDPGSNGVSVGLESLNVEPDGDLMSFFAAEPVGVSLDEAYCLAFRNSRLANLIDKERKAICCESGCIACIDRFLGGQAAEQRNKSAADAGELLIRLAGAQLQTEILEQSMNKVVELQRTIDAADENGLATAEAQSELDNQRLEINRKQSQLRAGVFEITTKLSLLLGLDSCYPPLILPSHHFDLEWDILDTQQLIIAALENRPEMNSLSGFGACSGDERCLAVLSNVDRRLGIAATKPVTRCLLRAKRQQDQNDCCCHIRQQQLDDLRCLREELIRQQVLEQVKNVHLHFENLTLENQNLKRLQIEAKLIDSSAQLDAAKAFIDSISNFAQQQLSKSRRVDSMVDYQVARIRLDEATGNLEVGCQSEVEIGCTSRIE